MGTTTTKPAGTGAAAPASCTGRGKAAAGPLRPCGGTPRHVLEGALAVLLALAAMTGAACLALKALGADGVAPLTRLGPAVTGLAFGGQLDLASDLTPQGSGEGDGGMPGMLGGGGGGGLSLGVSGQVSALPLMLTFLGTAVLGWCFFRPLRRRARPAPGLLAARAGGALGAAAVLVPLLVSRGSGTLELPDGVTEKLGKGGGPGGGLGKLTGGGAPSVDFTTHVALTGFLAVLGVALVLCGGLVAARRTSLPRTLELSRLRLAWHPVASTLTGIFTAVCTAALFLALLAGAAAATGREQAAKAAGALLLAAPNLITSVFTSGLGASWQAGTERRQPEGGGLLGGMGGGAGGSGAGGGDRRIDLGAQTVAGLPLWPAGLTLLTALLVYAGYRAAARTPARTAREESRAVLGRHLETAVRAGALVGPGVLVLCLLARMSVGIGITVMGNEMGGMDAGLDGSVGLSALTGSVLAGLAAYAGSRLHALRTARRKPGPRPGEDRTAGRPQVRTVSSPSGGKTPEPARMTGTGT
ncbi:streptophobe family protein [Streptomyces sp. HNM0574]|uniref:streptophobe family protein n=1 Tax=Streptomyces sp. HNM0574 TaxID=2714954 RepID=UPI00146B82B8|nr:streptophobe family protein [Streptomyces sp. HNM0574]NLU68285.1 hypothetical protein [Streptomyces sp. HNM0574]